MRFFGSYVGSVRRTGLSWILPLADRRKVSIRVRNFETNHLKVNDADGNPVEIATIVVWQVADTSRPCTPSTTTSTSYVSRLSPHCAMSLQRILTTTLPTMECHCAAPPRRGRARRGDGSACRDRRGRDHRGAHQSPRLRAGDRSGNAPPQQANAVVAARSRIVEGAVGMVELALERLDERGIVNLDEERKAAMVSNLLVVLCSDQPASPVVNTGTLYS